MCRHRELAARAAVWMRPDLPPEIARDGVEHTWSSYSGSFRNLVLGAQGSQDLERAAIPVRLIAGDRDEVVDRAFLQEQATRYAHVQFEVAAGAHDLPLTDPRGCLAALRALAREGDETF
jgi:pimeloyl-ACP methyl ester carboxylesterase